MSLPHFFTLLRVVISPLFPVLYLGYEWLGVPIAWLPYIMLGLLVVCECSDLFDGFLARRRNQVTDLGKVLDPMADSVTHISLFLTFTQGIVGLPLLLVLVFLYRELLISALRTLCALRGVVLAARFSGKVKAAMQGAVAFVIVLMMIPYTLGWISQGVLQQVSLFVVSVAALYTVVSVGDYLYANRVYIRVALQG